MVTVYDPCRRIVIKAVESTFPIEVDRSVEPAGTGSRRVTAVITGRPQGTIAGLVGPFVGRIAQNSINRDYDGLVELLESTDRPRASL